MQLAQKARVMLATACKENCARVFDVETGQELHKFQHSDCITSLAAQAPAFRAWPALTHLEIDATGSMNFKDVAGLESNAT